MSPHQVELALKKQRLQLRSASLREELAGHVAPFIPLFAAGDRLRDGALWLRRHPQVTAAVAVALLAARPRAVFRWGRRGIFAWQAWTRLRAWLEAHHRDLAR